MSHTLTKYIVLSWMIEQCGAKLSADINDLHYKICKRVSNYMYSWFVDSIIFSLCHILCANYPVCVNIDIADTKLFHGKHQVVIILPTQELC